MEHCLCPSILHPLLYMLLYLAFPITWAIADVLVFLDAFAISLSPARTFLMYLLVAASCLLELSWCIYYGSSLSRTFFVPAVVASCLCIYFALLSHVFLLSIYLCDYSKSWKISLQGKYNAKEKNVRHNGCCYVLSTYRKKPRCGTSSKIFVWRLFMTS
jgi:hypothetical protein